MFDSDIMKENYVKIRKNLWENEKDEEILYVIVVYIITVFIRWKIIKLIL